MEYRRYGKFQFGDYWSSWIGIACLLLFAFVGAIMEVLGWIVFIPIIYALIWLITICLPHSEKYTVSPSQIYVKKMRKENIITIPSDMIVIFSCIDICPPLAYRTAIGNTTHILKNQYAITILNQMPLKDLFNKLHRNGIKKYTTSMIQSYFPPYSYVYSCVYEEDVLECILHGKRYCIIIPESLVGEIKFPDTISNIYVDAGY